MESRRESRKQRRSFNWFAVVMLCIIGYFAFTLVNQEVHLQQVAEDQTVADARLAAAQKENDALKQEKADLEDLSYIEKIAREELGMTRHGELPYTDAGK